MLNFENKTKTTMRLYLLSRSDAANFDEYDAAVVCAEDEADARTISPSGEPFVEGEVRSSWALKSSDIICEEIGEANDTQTRGVILSSFVSA